MKHTTAVTTTTLPDATRHRLAAVNRCSKRIAGHDNTRTRAGLLAQLQQYWHNLLHHVAETDAATVFARLSSIARELLGVRFEGGQLVATAA